MDTDNIDEGLAIEPAISSISVFVGRGHESLLYLRHENHTSAYDVCKDV